MQFTKHHLLILAANLLSISFYGIRYLRALNFEFLGYIAVIIVGLFIMALTLRRVGYSYTLLWGLTLWGFLHLSGGTIPIGDGKILYELMLIPISENIFRFDQFVHIIGFGFSTLLMYEILKPYFVPLKSGPALVVVLLMAGLGVGAFNEIIEFIATVLVPETGVGGYTNTALDLVADMIGAAIACFFIVKKRNHEVLGN